MHAAAANAAPWKDVWSLTWAILRAKWAAKKRWERRHESAAALDSHVLKDVGLSHSDRTAIDSGLLTEDATRRQR